MYEGITGFVEGTAPFIRTAVDAREPVMVAVSPVKIGRLREALGSAADAVTFADMEELGRNPGRIIPAWQAFLAEHDGAPAARGIGEPIWRERTDDELVECQLHEALLNVAFADTAGFRLLCPYDASSLDEAVLYEARCSHPEIYGAGASEAYRDGDDLLAPFALPLPPPRGETRTLGFDRHGLDGVRRAVEHRAAQAGLPPARTQDLVLAANELATNSVRHGGGNGVLRMWEEGGCLVSEISDRGRIDDPLVGRRQPGREQIGGWGVWIAHQACDLVQVRTSRHGTAARLFMQLR